MTIEMIEKGEVKTITVQDLGSERKNSRLFHDMLNHFDPFWIERPVWTSTGRMITWSQLREDAMLASSNSFSVSI